MLDQLLVEYQIENPNTRLSKFESNLTYNVSNNAWEFPRNFDNNQPLLSVKDQRFTFQDFLQYLNKNQRSVKKEWSTAAVVKKQYAAFFRAIRISIQRRKPRKRK